MSYQDAVDRLDLIALAATAELCEHAEGRACCADCAVSVNVRMWDAIAAVVQEHDGEVPGGAIDHFPTQPL